MKKFFNFRPVVFLALIMLVASLFATKVFVAAKLKLVFFIVLISLSVVVFFAFAKSKKKILAVLAAALLFASYPFLNIFISSNKANNYIDANNQEVEVSGVISGRYKTFENGTIRFELDDAVVKYFSDEFKLGGVAYVYADVRNYSPKDDFISGTEISLTGKIRLHDYEKDNLDRDLSFLGSGVSAVINANEETFVFNGNRPNLRDKITTKVALMFDKAKLENADIAYALLFGDKGLLDSQINENFRITGIAHLLAVSGLHVSLIATLISFILRKCKVSPLVSMIVTTVILGFYCYLCKFSPSVVRATIMSLVLSYSVIRGKCYDGVSALALAAMISMIVKPTIIFSLAFQLSYLAVLAIYALMLPLKRGADKFLHGPAASSVAIQVAVQFGIAAITFHYFGYISALSFVANLILVPVASVAFTILICASLVTVILPFMSFSLIGYDALMGVVVRFDSWLAKVGMLISGSASMFVVLLTIFIMVIVSDYLFISKKSKTIATGMCMLAVSLLLLI